MVLPFVTFLVIKIHSRDAKEPRLWARETNLRPSILGSIDLACGAPSFVLVESLTDVCAKIVVDGMAGAVVCVEVLFKLMAWCTGRTNLVSGDSKLKCR